jgi:hypothetical protein
MILLCLLRSGCDVNIRTRDGRNALHEAVRKKMCNNVRILLAFGADHLAKDENGIDPLELWRKQAHLEMTSEEKERRIEVGKLLKSWSIIKKEHKNSEFVVLWQGKKELRLYISLSLYIHTHIMHM